MENIYTISQDTLTSYAKAQESYTRVIEPIKDKLEEFSRALPSAKVVEAGNQAMANVNLTNYQNTLDSISEMSLNNDTYRHISIILKESVASQGTAGTTLQSFTQSIEPMTELLNSIDFSGIQTQVNSICQSGVISAMEEINFRNIVSQAQNALNNLPISQIEKLFGASNSLRMSVENILNYVASGTGDEHAIRHATEICLDVATRTLDNKTSTTSVKIPEKQDLSQPNIQNVSLKNQTETGVITEINVIKIAKNLLVLWPFCSELNSAVNKLLASPEEAFFQIVIIAVIIIYLYQIGVLEWTLNQLNTKDM